MSEGEPKPQLDYAPPLPWRRRKRVRRRIVGLILVLLAVACGPTVWERVQVLWWQRQCLNYQASTDQVVYDDGPAVPRLLSGGGMLDPGDIRSSRQRVATRPVTMWDRLRPFVYPGQSRGIIYMHRGRDALGVERLIVVELDCRQFFQLDFVCWCLRPANPGRTIGRNRNGYTFAMASDSADKPLRLYAGQPDPIDPSRFTIRYDLDGQQGTIEGWVDERGGVSLAVKDGPAKRR